MGEGSSGRKEVDSADLGEGKAPRLVVVNYLLWLSTRHELHSASKAYAVETTRRALVPFDLAASGDRRVDSE